MKDRASDANGSVIVCERVLIFHGAAAAYGAGATAEKTAIG